MRSPITTRTETPASSTLWSRLGGDHGIAMASVILLGMILAVVAAVVLARAATTYTVTAGDRGWEDSLFVAEGGLDVALVEIEKDEDWFTVPSGTDLSTRNKIVAAAEALAADPANRIDTPDGEVVLLRELGALTVFTVGASPNWDVPTKKVRVIQATLDYRPWAPDYSLLVGGDLKIESKKKDKDVELLGDINSAHANGKIEAKIKDDEDIVGCLTGYGFGAPGQKFSNGDGADCPKTATEIQEIEEIEIPDIDPMAVHHLSQYELCPDGTIRYGPASGVPGASPAGSPCTGLVHPDPESFNIKDWDEGDKKVEFNSKESAEGVFFLYGRSAKVKLDHSKDVYYLTLIATKPNNELECRHVLPGGDKIDKDQYGDIEVDSHRSLRAHPDANGYLMVTVGDVKLKLKHKYIGEAHGMIFAREQVKLELQDATDPDTESSEKGGLRGWVVAQSACDTKDSKLDKNRSELKKGDIIYDGQFASPEFVAGPPTWVTSRKEL